MKTTWRFFLLGPSHSSGPTGGCLLFSLWMSISDSPASRLASSSPAHKLKKYRISCTQTKSDVHKLKSLGQCCTSKGQSQLVFILTSPFTYICAHMLCVSSSGPAVYFYVTAVPVSIVGTEGSPLEQEGKQCVGERQLFITVWSIVERECVRM